MVKKEDGREYEGRVFDEMKKSKTLRIQFG